MRNVSPYTLLHAATHAIRADNDTAPVEPLTPACGCCQRAWEAVEDPGVAFPYQYARGMATEFLCSACYTPRIGSKTGLGVEQRTGSTTPSGGKLGMLNNSGAIVTPDGVLHLVLTETLVRKFGGGHFGQQGQVHGPGVRPLHILLELIESSGFEPHRGFLFIERWGRKQDVLLRDLTLSYSLSEVWCNSDQGLVARDLRAHIDTAQELCRQGIADKGAKPAFWAPIRKAASSPSSDGLADAMEKWLAKVPEPQALLATLPVNPHDRLELPSMMTTLVPIVQDVPSPTRLAG